jgi:hypothetical protein
VIPVKRFAPFVVQFCVLLLAVPLVAQDARPQFNTIVVKHFTNTGKVNLPQDFIDHYSAGLIGELEWLKVAGNVVGEGVPVAAADTAGAIAIEGKFTQFDEGGMYAAGQLDVLINVYRISDGALVKTIPMSIPFRPVKPSSKNKDQNPGQYTGGRTALLLQQNLRKITLPTLAPAPSVANHPAPSAAPAAAALSPTPAVVAPSAAPTAAAPSAPPAVAAPAPSAIPAVASPSAHATPTAAAATPPETAQPCPAVFAYAQISTDPSGAEITIDGNYAGNTPSLINLKPGTHSIKITKNGYIPWVRSIEIVTGEQRTIAAALEPAK